MIKCWETRNANNNNKLPYITLIHLPFINHQTSKKKKENTENSGRRGRHELSSPEFILESAPTRDKAQPRIEVNVEPRNGQEEYIRAEERVEGIKKEGEGWNWRPARESQQLECAGRNRPGPREWRDSRSRIAALRHVRSISAAVCVRHLLAPLSRLPHLASSPPVVSSHLPFFHTSRFSPPRARRSNDPQHHHGQPNDHRSVVSPTRSSGWKFRRSPRPPSVAGRLPAARARPRSLPEKPANAAL